MVVFVARPLATAVSTLGSGFSLREKGLLGWAGLRGAVPVVLAIFPVIEHVPQSRDVLQHRLLRRAAVDAAAGHDDRRRSRAGSGSRPTSRARPASILEVGTVRELGADVVEHVIRPGDAAAGARLRDLGLPRDALVSLIIRGNEALLPRGSTRLEAGDRLLVLVRREVADELPELLERWRTGPVHKPVRPPRTYTGSVPVYTARPWTDADGDPAHPREIGRQRRGRAPAHAARRPGRARDPRRRPLRGHGPDPDDGPARAGPGPGAPPADRATDDAELAWWQEVIGACAL